MPQRIRGPSSEPRSWTQYLGVPDRAPSAREVLPADPQRVWQATIGRAAAGAVAVGDSVIALQATNRFLWVLWRATGERVWRARLNGPGATGPLMTTDRVYAASGGERGEVYAFRLGSGRKAWSQRLGRVHGPLARLGAHVYAATEDGWLSALSASDGKVQWRHRVANVLRSGVAVAGPHLVVTADDSLYLVDPQLGRVVTSTATHGTVYSPPAVHGNVLVISSPDGFLAGLDRVTLAELWRVDTEDAIFGSPAIARDTVFAATIAGALWSVPLSGGGAHHVVLAGAVRASPSPVADGVLIGTVAGELLWVDPRRGRLHWQLTLEGAVDHPPVVDHGELVVADGQGVVQLWR